MGPREMLLADISSLNAQVHTLAVDMVAPVSLPQDLTIQQIRALVVIARSPELTGNELGEQLQVSAPTVTGLVDRLIEKGLVRRLKDPMDQRVRRMHATRTGRRMLENLHHQINDLIALVLPDLSLEDLLVIRHSSEIILSILQKSQKNEFLQTGLGL